jgi:hypothetical protein
MAPGKRIKGGEAARSSDAWLGATTSSRDPVPLSIEMVRLGIMARCSKLLGSEDNSRYASVPRRESSVSGCSVTQFPQYPFMGRDNLSVQKKIPVASPGCCRLGFVSTASAAESFRSRFGSKRRAETRLARTNHPSVFRIDEGSFRVTFRVNFAQSPFAQMKVYAPCVPLFRKSGPISATDTLPSPAFGLRLEFSGQTANLLPTQF